MLTSQMPPNLNSRLSSLPLLLRSGQATMVKELRSRFPMLQKPWQTSPIPLNWLENQAQSTKKQKRTHCC
eukprot:9298965-Ditylum_brightwellii.AAC.1